MSRSTLIGIAALLVVIAGIFILVGQSDVDTKVFSPTPTGNPNSWVESGESEYTYKGNPDIVLSYQTLSLESLLTTGVLVAEGQNPLMAVLQNTRDGFESDITQSGLTITDSTFNGPNLETHGDVPVALLQTHVDAQTTAAGEFPGMQIIHGFIDQNNGQVVYLQVGARGAYDPALYDDLLAWLDANAPRLLTLEPAAEATAEAEPEAATTAEPEGASTAEPEAATTAEPEGASTAEPELETTAEPEIVATAETIATPPADATWEETQPGEYAYGGDPDYILAYQVESIEDMISQLGAEVAEGEDPLLPLLTVMQQQLTDLFTQQYGLAGLASEGPTVEEMNGVTVGWFRTTIPAQSIADGTEFPGANLVEAFINQGDGQITVIQYVAQSSDDTNAYNAFRTWLSDNVSMLMTAEPAAAPETTQAPTDFTGQDLVLAFIDRGDGDVTFIQLIAQGALDEQIYADFETWLTDNAEHLTDPDSEAPTPAEGSPWNEVAEGYVVNNNNPSAGIQYTFTTLNDVVTQLQLEAPAEDSENPFMDLAEQFKGKMEEGVVSANLEPTLTIIEGPEIREYNGVSVVFLRIAVPAQPYGTPEGTAEPGTAATAEPDIAATVEATEAAE
jgi:hypothetical protein